MSVKLSEGILLANLLLTCAWAGVLASAVLESAGARGVAAAALVVSATGVVLMAVAHR